MFYFDHLTRALNEQREDFAQFYHVWRDDARFYAARLREKISDGTVGEINEAALGTGARRGPGALLSKEFENCPAVVVSFPQRWRSHEEARRWAVEVLRDRTTFAADGSQLLPGRDLSLPTAVIQVATFENAHSAGGRYQKDARLQVITPRELLEGYGDAQWTAESVVGFRRFEEEMRALLAFIERQRGWRERGERAPVGFFDGTLLISYARPRTRLQDKYVETVLRLINLSREAEVPVVGFIDQSYARDIVNFVEAFDSSGRPSTSLYDAQVLHAVDDPLFTSWGDRTKLFLCAREGLKDEFNDAQGQPLVGFVYLRTVGAGTPARLDLPVWIHEAQLLDEVMDVVRAECVVGNGYPYPIETADAAAVITARDREKFLRVLQEFAERENFSLQFSRKSASKTHRR